MALSATRSAFRSATRPPGYRWFPAADLGCSNLLVGNGFGDVLILEGKGDGTFQIQGSRVSLSVVPNLLGPGQAGVLVGDQQNNRVTVQAPSANGDAVHARADARRSILVVASRWRPATSSGRSSTRGRPCPTPSW